MNYAILRTKKLKSFGAAARSARHTFREQPTPNANPAESGRNRTDGAIGAVRLLEALRGRLPDKRRSNAVLCIEYLVTASPEVFKRHGGRLDDLGNGYFRDALAWLKKRHGADNVLSATVHLDESTPHLVAYAVPRTEDGRLSCRDFLGGPAKMRAMQDSFHTACGLERGLERGVMGSKAKHEAVSAFYSTMTFAGEAPALKPRDYAAAAVGVKTETWLKAEEVAKANAIWAARGPRTRKASRSQVKAIKNQTKTLEQKAQSLSQKEIQLRFDQDDCERRSRRLAAREKEVSTAEHKVMLLEAERDALERRFEILERRSRAENEAPVRGRKYDIEQTLG
ncbi:MobV family relaxase [Pseudomonas palmensis]|uniref:MobV family relaxase n=1 Tax=Pseudomonas palmensis TaxID=2815362 RepID=UPI0039E7E1C1